MKEDIDRVIRYVYNEFGREFGDSIVDLKQQLQVYKDKEKNMDDYIKELLEVNKDINNQFQAYKDKEEKLREILKYEYSDTILGRHGADLKQKLLQILNEGDK